MLLNRVKETNKLIKLDTQIVELQKVNGDFERVKKRVSSIKIAASNYTDSFKSLKMRDNEFFESEDLDKVIKMVVKLERELKSEYIDHALIDSITKEVNSLEEGLKQRWKTYFEKDTVSLRNAINTVSNISSDRQSVNEVITALSIHKAQWPVNDITLQKFDNNIAKGEKIISDLGLNPKIEEFLSKIVTNTATIFDLDEEILEWIKEKELSEKIGLRFR